ncbi:MAG: hypothetical protein M1822_004720 [Bathelium mastoideum]|nr:MAG: hypothetical protein M1822_004720 [Bathelium mastoideum]
MALQPINRDTIYEVLGNEFAANGVPWDTTGTFNIFNDVGIHPQVVGAVGRRRVKFPVMARGPRNEFVLMELIAREWGRDRWKGHLEPSVESPAEHSETPYMEVFRPSLIQRRVICFVLDERAWIEIERDLIDYEGLDSLRSGAYDNTHPSDCEVAISNIRTARRLRESSLYYLRRGEGPPAARCALLCMVIVKGHEYLRRHVANYDGEPFVRGSWFVMLRETWQYSRQLRDSFHQRRVRLRNPRILW